MFKNIINKWKSEWLEKQREALNLEFEGDISQFKKSLDKTILDMDENKQKLIQSNKDELVKLEAENRELRKVLLAEQQDIEINRIGFKTESLKLQSELTSLQSEYESKKSILLSEHKAEMQRINAEHDSEISVIKKRISSKNSMLEVDEREVDHLQKIVDDKKSELESLNNNLRTQIKVLEGKASPSNVWAEAFTAGASKIWDLIIPVMVGNIDKLKDNIREEATEEVIRRLPSGNNKKAE